MLGDRKMNLTIGKLGSTFKIVFMYIYYGVVLGLAFIALVELWDTFTLAYLTGDMKRLIGGERFGVCYSSLWAYRTCVGIDVGALTGVVGVAIIANQAHKYLSPLVLTLYMAARWLYFATIAD